VSRSIDLNADVGESFGRWTLGADAALLPHLSSANVACGFHAGDPTTIRRTCALAVTHGVTIGAQVGYRDLAGFGRRFIDIDPADLAADVAYQIGGAPALARSEGGTVRYVKPHGALYHAMSSSPFQAQALVSAVAEVDPTLVIVGFPGSHLDALTEAAGLALVHEGFADRRYEHGRLLDRARPDAVLTDTAAVAAQAVSLASAGAVATICLHGDTPGADRLAAAVRVRLAGEGISIAPFAG